jgi:hypothetical protein
VPVTEALALVAEKVWVGAARSTLMTKLIEDALPTLSVPTKV